MKFIQKKWFGKSIKWLIMGSLSAFSLNVMGSVEKPIDLHASHFVAKLDDCIVAAKKCYLEVIPSAPQENRYYQIYQHCDEDNYLRPYWKPIKDQVTSRTFLGNKFCNGLVSGSHLPLPNIPSTYDSSVGLNLIEIGRQKIATISDLLRDMKKIALNAESDYTSLSGREEMDREFQLIKSEINRHVQVTTFDGIQLFSGTLQIVDIPVNGGKNRISIKLPNLTIQSGLNISGLNVLTRDSAVTARAQLEAAMKIAADGLEKLQANEKKLKEAFKHDSVFTTFDLTDHVFKVHSEGQV